ncbi:phosphatase PAP2 family protein [Piscinibacterium candidicorallinum]|uniref:Phosphatase PAP2 family protein n=1 Tax=Piscinibacterium candidicorallinum TaxID=1793872 RepID=A0ABV7H772_9BURK
MSTVLNAPPGSGHAWQHRLRLDLCVSAAALLLLAAWDFSGADLIVSRMFADASGFALRNDVLLARVFHDGGRYLGWVVLAAMLWIAVRSSARGSADAPPRRLQLQWIGVMLGCVILIGAIKRFSLTSCPWELAEFGGLAHWVSHWLPGVSDGGPGGCFPSGHAVTAFAFLGAWQLWRPWRPRAAQTVLLIVLFTGALFGAVQLIRGAHYLSHTLWTAWICWTLCALAAAWLHRRLPESDRRPQ